MTETTDTNHRDHLSLNSPSTPSASKWLRATSARAGQWPRLAVLLGSFSTLFLLVQAWAIAYIAQRLVMDSAPLSSIIMPVALLPLAFIMRGICARYKTIAGIRAGIRVRQSVRQELLQRLEEKGPLWIRHQHSATLNTRIWDEVDALNDYYADFLPQITLCALIPLIILCVVFPLNWAAGLILAITGPLIPLNMAMVGMGAKSLQEAQFREMGRLNRHYLDTVRGLPTLKLFGLGRLQAKAVERVSEDFRIRTMKVLRLAFLSSTALEFFASVSIAILAIYIGFTFLGNFHFGTWGHGLNLFIGLFILILAPEFYQPLRELGTHYHAKAAAEAAAETLIPMLAGSNTDTLQTTQTNIQKPVPSDLGPMDHSFIKEPPKPIELQVHHVSAHYNSSAHPALNDVSFSLPSGKTLAIIGPSGAGKSTLLNILMGFLVPSSGYVVCNGTRLEAIPASEWRKSMAWVGQHSTLIKGTLADNLHLAAGTQPLSEERLWSALEQAQLKEWANQLPAGLETPIGEGGQPVSGGQARRISLARAFIRNAPFTLLDEPTASLDMESEQRVISGLETLRPHTTMIMLTHRLELLRLSDHILVLEHGKVSAFGDLESLSQPEGPLAYLMDTQEGDHV